MKALLLEKIHPSARQRFESANIQISEVKSSLSEAELSEAIKGVDILGIRSKTQITSSLLKKASNLKAIGTFCIGTNQVDLSSAKSFGIPVFNSPYSNTRSVAELVISHIIALSRRSYHLSELVHKGEWFKTAENCHEVRNKTLGIIGYGHIGTQVGILAESLGLSVQYFDIEEKLPLGNAQPTASLHELLKSSDFVSLHVPLTEETKWMMGSEQLQSMKIGSHLINYSRGQVGDLKALSELIKSKHLLGAAIDVYPEEPKSNSDPFESPLRGLDNVILTPHIGGSTQEAQKNIGLEVSRALIKYLRHGDTSGSVNFPKLMSSPKKTKARIFNVHKNQPGVLSQINEFISSQNVNIETQVLMTDTEIGCLVLDANFLDVSKVKAQFDKFDFNIKTYLM